MVTITHRRRRIARGLVAAAFALPAIAIGAPLAAAQGTAGESTSDDDARPCVSEDIKLIYQGRAAAAGTQYIEFAMQRIQGDSGPTTEPCLMSDRVGMHWIDELGGQRVGSWADYSDEHTPPFVVPPGGHATLTVAQPDPRNYEEEECEPTPVAGIQIYLEFEGDEGTYGSTGGKDVMCAKEGVAVPTVEVSEAA